MSTSSSAAPQQDQAKVFKNSPYKPVLNNWYTSQPYGFKFTPNTGSALVMYLPINPSNLNITTHFATNIIATIYGTVEEHSPVRYYDITVEGTTGMAPKYVDPADAATTPTVSKGRSAFAIQQNLGTGLFTKTLATITNIVNDAAAIINGGKPSTPKTGLKLDQTGYSAFHNLYRFLLAHKADVTSGTTPRAADAASPLIFFNYKDGNEYSVVVRNFTLRRDKENPMLYYYNIAMRGYNLKAVDSDKWAPRKDEDLLKDLGLNGVKGSSYLGEIKNAAAGAKDIYASVINGTNQLGR